MAEKTKETSHYEFKAEIKQLLDILVHSLYTNREIFLRELVSNASDALDKLRFESTRGADYEDKDLPLEIKIGFDKDKHIVTVSDTGIGMTREELVTNIGTIAKSGSSDFIKQLKDNKETANNIIGKFGVGFYSVFMVADKVVIKTKSYKKDATPVMWESDGSGSYDIADLDEQLKRGTTIEIHLKEDAHDYAEKYRLENIVKKHSNFISFPILIEDNRVNTVQALWREPKSSVKQEQYNEFYKFLSYDTEDPLKHIHLSVDAPIQFNALLFIPKKNMDMFNFNRDNYGLDLYVRRVLIQHQNKDLLPEYLGFVKGVVDSEDLPLNISRETLQENVIFNKISQSVTSQVLNQLDKMTSENPELYAEFWKEHQQVFKMGYTDYSNQEKFQKLLRFNSSIHEDKKGLTSLEEYVSRKKKDQKEIYYVFGPSREAVKMDPHLEIFRSKGLEVLFLFDPIDEFVMSAVHKFDDMDLVSVDQADLKKIEEMESEAEEKETKAEELNNDDKKHFGSLLSKVKEILGDKVTEVRESQRLKESPACLVNPDNTMSSSMQKIMQVMNKDTSVPKKIMEINKDHVLVRNLLKIYKANPDDEYIKNAAEQLYESSLLLEGYLTDPHVLVNRINKLLEQSSGWYTDVKKI